MATDEGRSQESASDQVVSQAVKGMSHSGILSVQWSGVAWRLLSLIMVFSTVVTLLLTIVQLYFDYRRDVGVIESRLVELETSYVDSLAGSLWNVDSSQIKIQLEGIRRLPDMQAVEVRETGGLVAKPLVVTVGRRNPQATVSREIPIVYNDRGVNRVIGMLYAEATLEGVYQRLIDKAVVILVTQGLKTFLVSTFILLIFHWLVTRHLGEMATFLASYDFRNPPSGLVLKRRTLKKKDELDHVVGVINEMATRLQNAYVELREINAKLEVDIVARTNAEAEVVRLNAVLEERVQQRTAELEAANRELGAFTYSVSHDLRAPLRRIEGFAKILTNEGSQHTTEQSQHYLNRIQAGARDMTDMIDSFLKMSRSTRGELTVDVVNLSTIANEIVSSLREKDPERLVDVTVDSELTIKGDERLMKAVMENLLDNAWKYTKGTATPKIHVGSYFADGKKVVFVKDNGVGFNMAYASRLFTPFSRLHRASEFEGTGIGLATVQRIIARHGGRIWADGKLGQGANFCFTFWERETADE